MSFNSLSKGVKMQNNIRKIPEKWDIVKVKDVAKINELSVSNNYQHDKIEYIDIKSVEKRQILNVQHLLLSEAPSRARRIVRVNDILISTVRPNLKHFTFLKNAKANTIASTGFAVITPYKVNPQYLYYYLTTDQFTNFLSQIADTHTSTYPALNPDVIENADLFLPPDEEQNKIGNTLGALDEKIELNRQMNTTLEAIGQAKFKHWFMDFEFPNEEGKPYKSSGGEMKETELGEVPVGWKLVNLEDIADVIDCLHSKKPKKKDKGELLLQVYNVGQNGLLDLSDPFYISEEDYKLWTRRMMLNKGDLVITKTGRVGAIARIPRGVFSALGRNMVGIRVKQEFSNSHFLRDCMLSDWMRSEIQRRTNDGTILQSLHVKSINVLRICLPSPNLLKSYEEITKPIHEKIEENAIESHTLASIRDALLPKLMSGEIRVNHN